MGQEYFATTVTFELQFIEYYTLRCFGNFRTIEIGALSVAIAL